MARVVENGVVEILHPPRRIQDDSRCVQDDSQFVQDDDEKRDAANCAAWQKYLVSP